MNQKELLVSNLKDEEERLKTLQKKFKDLENLVFDCRREIWSCERVIGSLKIQITDVALIDDKSKHTINDFDNGFFRAITTTEGINFKFKNNKEFTGPKDFNFINFKYISNNICYIHDKNVYIISETEDNIIPIHKKLYKKSKYPEVIYVTSEYAIIKMDNSNIEYIFSDNESIHESDYESDCSDGECFRNMFGFSRNKNTSSILFISEKKDGQWSEFKEYCQGLYIYVNDLINKTKIQKQTLESTDDRIYANYDYRFIISPDLKWSIVLTFDEHASIFNRHDENLYIYKNNENGSKLIKKIKRIENKKTRQDDDVIFFTNDNKIMIISKNSSKIYDPELL